MSPLATATVLDAIMKKAVISSTDALNVRTIWVAHVWGFMQLNSFEYFNVQKQTEITNISLAV